jgi:hypothetical protein
MKQALFYMFLFVFGATAAVTLLGLTQMIPIQQGYLDKLFYLLIAESITPVIALFKKTDFFGVTPQDALQIEDTRLSVVLLPKESFPRSGDPHQCTVRIYSQESDNEREVTISPKRANGYLSTFLETISENELITVSVRNSQNELWESEYFNPSVAKAEMVKI